MSDFFKNFSHCDLYHKFNFSEYAYEFDEEKFEFLIWLPDYQKPLKFVFKNDKWTTSSFTCEEDNNIFNEYIAKWGSDHSSICDHDEFRIADIVKQFDGSYPRPPLKEGYFEKNGKLCRNLKSYESYKSYYLWHDCHVEIGQKITPYRSWGVWSDDTGYWYSEDEDDETIVQIDHTIPFSTISDRDVEEVSKEDGFAAGQLIKLGANKYTLYENIPPKLIRYGGWTWNTQHVRIYKLKNA